MLRNDRITTKSRSNKQNTSYSLLHVLLVVIHLVPLQHSSVFTSTFASFFIHFTLHKPITPCPSRSLLLNSSAGSRRRRSFFVPVIAAIAAIAAIAGPMIRRRTAAEAPAEHGRVGPLLASHAAGRLWSSSRAVDPSRSALRRRRRCGTSQPAAQSPPRQSLVSSPRCCTFSFQQFFVAFLLIFSCLFFLINFPSDVSQNRVTRHEPVTQNNNAIIAIIFMTQVLHYCLKNYRERYGNFSHDFITVCKRRDR